jgi:subtilisin family serine protease
MARKQTQPHSENDRRDTTNGDAAAHSAAEHRDTAHAPPDAETELAASSADPTLPPENGTQPADRSDGVSSAPEEFLIAPARSSSGLPPLQTLAATFAGLTGLLGVPSAAALTPMTAAARLSALADQIHGGDIEVLERIAPTGLAAMDSPASPAPPPLIVARMTPEKAEALSGSVQGEYIIARNSTLALADLGQFDARPVLLDPAVTRTAGGRFSFTVTVQGTSGPLPNCDVFIYGTTTTVQSVTDANGQAVFSLGSESPGTIQGLLVQPSSGYWNRLIRSPQLSSTGTNTVVVDALSSSLPGFPDKQLIGWGQRIMGLNQLPSGFTGAGVRVAVIDSGADVAHRDLVSVKHGFDFPGNNAESWKTDSVGHGSHCAGIICGVDNGTGIRGFAPGAEVHALRILPEGRIDDLVKALNYCIDHGIDVVNLSLGGLGDPAAVAQIQGIVEPFFAKAKSLGVACIVAAGNSAGPVMYPGSSPNVLTVSAIGKLGEFPADSYHAALPLAPTQNDGLFFPRFSCFGPEVGVAGPGVAVVSSVPGDNFVAWDGTSMATPHIVGLAALVLAHNPDFKTAYKARNSARVDHLFQVLKSSAERLNLGDPNRTGAGLPDATAAMQPRFPSATTGAPMAARTGATTGPTPEQIAEIARRVIASLQGSGGPRPPL